MSDAMNTRETIKLLVAENPTVMAKEISRVAGVSPERVRHLLSAMGLASHTTFPVDSIVRVTWDNGEVFADETPVLATTRNFVRIQHPIHADVTIRVLRRQVTLLRLEPQPLDRKINPDAGPD